MINSITEEDYKLLVPKDTSVDIDSMEENIKKSFLFLTSAYRYFLLQLLLSKTNIKEYDDLLSSSELKFVPVLDEKKDYYQKDNSELLKYFYLRSNIYISHLSGDEIINFGNLYKKHNGQYCEEIEEFLLKTCHKVLTDYIGKEKFNICYGPSNDSFSVPCDSLKIGVRYEEFYFDGKDEKQWDENHEKQLDFLFKMIDELENNLTKTLGMDVRILYYNDFSVVKKNDSSVSLI